MSPLHRALEAIRAARLERQRQEDELYYQLLAAGLVAAAPEHDEFEVSLAEYDRNHALRYPSDAELDARERARDMNAEVMTREERE